MDDESILDFNFWPAFADLMLSLVLILLLVIAVVYASLAVGSVNLRHVQENQEKMVDAIATIFNGKPEKIGEDSFAISTIEKDSRDIVIKNEPTFQRFSFSTQVLFDSDQYQLKQSGQRVLSEVGGELKKQFKAIGEIQIQGHADTDPTFLHRSNLDLAALRAMEVFKFMQDSVGVDPASYLMSATSFGEYKPLQRAEDDSTYSRARLSVDNATTVLKDRNRRIELLLFYRIK